MDRAIEIAGRSGLPLRIAAKVGAEAMRRKAYDDAQNGVEELRRQGMEVVTDLDRKAFEDALKPAFAEYAKKFGQDKIDEIRNYRY